MKTKISIIVVLTALPLISCAQFLVKTGGFFGALKNIVFTILIPLAFMLSLVFFLWGIAKFIWQEGQGKEDGKKIMIWGIVALFVISSIWGIVRFLQGEFGVTNNSPMAIPKFGNSSNGDSPYEVAEDEELYQITP